MNILSVEKYYFTTGGASRVFFETNRLLAERGHTVIPFCGRYPQNLETPFAPYFVPRFTAFSGEGDAGVPLSKYAKAFADAVYARDVAAAVRKLVRDHPVDIAHLHTILYQISPSVIVTLKRLGIPVVQTLHDFSMVCASRYLYTAGAVCERCRGGRYLNVLRRNCCNGNPWLSLMSFTARSAHHAFRLYPGRVDMFIAPSRFVRDKMVAWGLPPRRIVHINHFLPEGGRPASEAPEGDYALFAGYLVRPKGIFTLLDAMARLPRTRLLIAGRGPERERVAHLLAARGLSRVELVGFKSRAELDNLIRGARFLIFPSEAYETFGMGILEAHALGRPVVASAIGAYPEVVKPGETGLLFEPGDADALAKCIRRLDESADLRRDMGERARAWARKEFHEDQHYQSLRDVYERLVGA